SNCLSGRTLRLEQEQSTKEGFSFSHHLDPGTEVLSKIKETKSPEDHPSQPRKPVVEKMRRDRINSSIEQLKLLLEREFRGQQPSAKVEKADVLEMAVSYLQLHSQPETQASSLTNLQQDFKQGYLNCLRESLHFLSCYEPKKEAQLMKHFCESYTPLADNPSPAKWALPSPSCHFTKAQTPQENAAASAAVLWRPW
uniref:Transcription factor HES-5 n=1 Tax=Geotrypetes seraphini TaxID=260995 RepID=A0A6P8PPL8_GEOSA